MYPIQTIGWMGQPEPPPQQPPPPANAPLAEQVFAGCTNRTEVAAYMAALAFERQVRGITIGIVVGFVGALGIGWYLKGKG